MNLLNIFQDEPSGVHWDHKQTTIFPIVNYYRCLRKKCRRLITHEQTFLGPGNLPHDHFAVSEFVARSRREIREMGVKDKDHAFWTDNCKRQFKGKASFLKLSEEMISTTLNFFGPRHGKNPSDGVTGRVKQAARRAHESCETVLQTA